MTAQIEQLKEEWRKKVGHFGVERIYEGKLKRAKWTALPWNCENVVDYIYACRLDGGIPIFRAKWWLPLIDEEGNRYVEALCLYGRGRVEHQYFKNPPPEDLLLIATKEHEWIDILKKCGESEEDIRRLIDLPIEWSYRSRKRR